MISTQLSRKAIPGPIGDLKKAWVAMTDEERAFWMDLFLSPEKTLFDVRAEILKRLDIDIKHDSTISKFRSWWQHELRYREEAELQREELKRAIEDNPTWSLDQAREAVLSKGYRRAEQTGDFDLGVAIIKQDLAAQNLKLDRDKFEFRAAELALSQIESLRSIKADSNLTEEQKIKQARIKLFGEEAVC
jgi:hypothetical protein